MLIISELFVVGKSTSWWRDDCKATLEMVSNACKDDYTRDPE